MKELSFWDIDAPHLHDYFVSKKGQFKITKISDNETLLEGTTWYSNKIKPNFYWNLWSDYIVHKIHDRVLKHLKQTSEKNSPIEKSNKIDTSIKTTDLVFEQKPLEKKLIQKYIDSIKIKTANNLLTKKVETQMDPEGGFVYGYYDKNDSLISLYSSFGAEFGKDETCSFFKDGEIIYSEYRNYWFYYDNSGTKINEKLIAEKHYFQPGTEFSIDTLIFIHNNKKPPYKTLTFDLNDIPSPTELAISVKKMRSNLRRFGK